MHHAAAYARAGHHAGHHDTRLSSRSPCTRVVGEATPDARGARIARCKALAREPPLAATHLGRSQCGRSLMVARSRRRATAGSTGEGLRSLRCNIERGPHTETRRAGGFHRPRRHGDVPAPALGDGGWPRRCGAAAAVRGRVKWRALDSSSSSHSARRRQRLPSPAPPLPTRSCRPRRREPTCP